MDIQPPEPSGAALPARPACNAVALREYVANDTRVPMPALPVEERAALLDQARDAVFVLDIEQRVCYWNGGAERLFGWKAQEAVGARAVDLIGFDGDGFAHACERAQREGKWCGELRHQHKDGSIVETESHCSMIVPSPRNGGGAKILVTSDEVGERKKNEARMFRLAYFDPLTELPNRTTLLDCLHKALLKSVRNHGVGAVMFCDLDNFKKLNDTKGHAAGDAMLRAVARRLENSVRETDVVARLGGDEFVVLLDPGDTTYEDAARRAESVAENILRNMVAPILLADESHPISTSIGITLFCGVVDTTESVLMKADAAMYQAKAAGRNTLRFFDPMMQASIVAQQQLESDLSQALTSRAFVLHFQPQVDAAGRIAGAEALIRWRLPDGRLVLPSAFIKAAEASGQIQEIGNWVLATACAQLAEWAGAPETRGLSLSVNVSAHQFVEPGFLSTVAGILAHTGADPRRLKLELTESLLFSNTDSAVATMDAMKAIGVTFTLDDFGTGYSSLAYLRRLPLDQLKIDRSFMRDVLSNANDAAIVRSIIALGSNLGIGVIAEGVETQAQRDLLAQEGCGHFQGFLFGHAMPNQQFLLVLRRAGAALAAE